jgi:hypothetical protein
MTNDSRANAACFAGHKPCQIKPCQIKPCSIKPCQIGAARD